MQESILNDRRAKKKPSYFSASEQNLTRLRHAINSPRVSRRQPDHNTSMSNLYASGSKSIENIHAKPYHNRDNLRQHSEGGRKWRNTLAVTSENARAMAMASTSPCASVSSAPKNFKKDNDIDYIFEKDSFPAKRPASKAATTKDSNYIR